MAHLDAILDPLSKRSRVAVGCVWVEHVLDIYKRGNFAYAVGAAAPLLRADPTGDLLEAAIALAWTFAETGTTIDPAAAAAVIDAMKENPNDMESDDMAVAAVGIMGAVHHLLDTAQDPTPHAARETASDCYCAVSDMIAAVSPKPARAVVDEGYDSEKAWQLQALDRISQRGSQPLTRSAFADLIAVSLPWRRYLDDYSRAVRD